MRQSARITADGSGPLGQAAGGYTAALAWASSAGEYQQLVEEYMERCGLEVLEIEDIEEFEQRCRTGDPDLCLVALSTSVNAQHPVGVDVYDTYADDNEDE